MPEAPASASPTPRARRPRRSSAELREVLLSEARAAFAESGYGGTSTRAIARSADASESLIFTNWGSKAGIFRAAVVEPFQSFLERFSQAWDQGARTATLEPEAREFISGLYDLFRDHRDLVLALVAAEAFEPEASATGLHEAFATILTPIEELVAEECRRRGWDQFDPTVITEAMVGMVLSMTVLDGVLRHDDDRRDRDLVIDQITLFWAAALREPPPSSHSI